MNINEAKTQIKNAMTAYFSKDELGNYEIPVEKQRPVFLMGPPGIGKTAVMEQIASEMGVGLLSYSMTHHTRQSALGLPYIEHKTYGGKDYEISEYTMSEIIAAVYDLMEETGVREGILFLDEINCVSETLAPVMLQFLQYKVFGRHRVPDGWIVVTAGNPPEYNNSVREFDIVTWDRLKRIDVEPDFNAWKEYAYKTRVHPAVLTYLEIKKADFYKVGSTVEGKKFITARGWDDLSKMLILYEKHGIEVDEKLTSQYIQEEKISRSFANYYNLWGKYRSDYQIDDILSGKASEEIKKRAKDAKFDERLSLLGLVLGQLSEELSEIINGDELLFEILGALKTYKLKSAKPKTAPSEAMREVITETYARIEAGKKAGNLTQTGEKLLHSLIKTLENELSVIADEADSAAAFKLIKADFDKRVKDAKKTAADAGKRLTNAFVFLDEVFPEGQEMLIFVTELTANYHTARFIGKYGCKEYFAHNKELMFYERQQQILIEIDDLTLD